MWLGRLYVRADGAVSDLGLDLTPNCAAAAASAAASAGTVGFQPDRHSRLRASTEQSANSEGLLRRITQRTEFLDHWDEREREGGDERGMKERK